MATRRRYQLTMMMERAAKMRAEATVAKMTVAEVAVTTRTTVAVFLTKPLLVVQAMTRSRVVQAMTR